MVLFQIYMSMLLCIWILIYIYIHCLCELPVTFGTRFLAILNVSSLTLPSCKATKLSAVVVLYTIFQPAKDSICMLAKNWKIESSVQLKGNYVVKKLCKILHNKLCSYLALEWSKIFTKNKRIQIKW